MGNQKILVTTGVAVAALLSGIGQQAEASATAAPDVLKDNSARKAPLESQPLVLQHMMYRLGGDNHSLTLHRSDTGVLYAGHGSHASHGSHGSHGSHRSGR